MEISTVKEELAKGARAFKAFEKGMEIVTFLEGLDQFQKELLARTEALKSEEAALVQSLPKMKADIEQTVNNANSKAAAIIETAKAEATQIAQKAEAEKNKILDGIDKTKTELDRLKAEAAAQKKDNEGLKNEFLALQNQKEELLAKLRSIVS